MLKNHRDLKVWQKSYGLGKDDTEEVERMLKALENKPLTP